MQDLVSERKFYDELFAKNPDNEHILDGYEDLHQLAFPTVPKGLVFDLGCGTGGHTIRLARRGLRMVAADLTRGGVRAARERLRAEGKSGLFLVTDAEHLPFRDGSIEVIWTSLLLHHFPKLDKLPPELSRVAKSQVIAFEVNAKNPLSWLAFNVINPVWGLSSTTKNQRALWPGKLKRTFEKAGFDVTSLTYIHRAWTTEPGLFGFIRRVFTIATSWMPLSCRANKYLIIFRKRA